MSKLRGTSWPRQTTNGLSSSTTHSRLVSSKLDFLILCEHFLHISTFRTETTSTLWWITYLVVTWCPFSSSLASSKKNLPSEFNFETCLCLTVTFYFFLFLLHEMDFLLEYDAHLPGSTSRNWFVPSTASTRWASSTGTSSPTTSW